MAFESGGVLEDWRSAGIVPQYKVKGEKSEYRNYGGITLSVVGKMYAGILVERIYKETGGLMMSMEALEWGEGVEIKSSP